MVATGVVVVGLVFARTWRGSLDICKVLYVAWYGITSPGSNYPREAATTTYLALIFRRIASGVTPGSSVQQR